METKEITVREHIRYLVDRAVEKTRSDNSEHAFIRVTHRFRPDEVHEPKNTDSETVLFKIYNETKRMRITYLGDGYHIESEISGRNESVLTPEDVVDTVYKDIEQMRLEPCDAPPSNIQEFLYRSIDDVKYVLESGNLKHEIKLTTAVIDESRIAVDMHLLSAKERIGFARFEEGGHGGVEVHYKGQQKPTVITDDKSRYDRLTALAPIVEQQLEHLYEHAATDLKELSDEQAMEQ